MEINSGLLVVRIKHTIIFIRNPFYGIPGGTILNKNFSDFKAAEDDY